MAKSQPQFKVNVPGLPETLQHLSLARSQQMPILPPNPNVAPGIKKDVSDRTATILKSLKVNLGTLDLFLKSNHPNERQFSFKRKKPQKFVEPEEDKLAIMAKSMAPQEILLKFDDEGYRKKAAKEIISNLATQAYGRAIEAVLEEEKQMSTQNQLKKHFDSHGILRVKDQLIQRFDNPTAALPKLQENKSIRKNFGRQSQILQQTSTVKPVTFLDKGDGGERGMAVNKYDDRRDVSSLYEGKNELNKLMTATERKNEITRIFRTEKEIMKHMAIVDKLEITSKAFEVMKEIVLKYNPNDQNSPNGKQEASRLGASRQYFVIHKNAIRIRNLDVDAMDWLQIMICYPDFTGIKEVELHNTNIPSWYLDLVLHYTTIQQLDMIDITQNKMTLQIAEKLERLMVRSHSLHSMYLSNMQIDDQMAIPLLRGVAINKTINELDLSNNQLTAKTAGIIKDILKYVKNLKIVDLRGNQFDERSQSEFMKVSESRYLSVILK